MIFGGQILRVVRQNEDRLLHTSSVCVTQVCQNLRTSTEPAVHIRGVAAMNMDLDVEYGPRSWLRAQRSHS